MKTDHINCFSSHATSDLSLPTTTSLEALQCTEQRELMDLVDRLRRAGLSSILQLPQIVVCGDQSSGKSSVLEAITEIPFPRKENLCTRFATEIVMRRDVEPSILCRINPDDSRPEDEQRKLRNFSKSIKDFSELPSLIDEATALMGLDIHKAFSRDVLSIEICGPGRPQLTLVDLPGLIHSSNKSQSEDDVTLIKSLVRDYISEKRTIVLAVISAKNDYANQIILKDCREFDPKGARTLGVITKPDYLRADSENEREWLDLAQNRDIYFELGWHLLKNRADGEHHLSFAERNIKELAFFGCGNYKALPLRMKGVDSLRKRLSKLLFDHLRQELPALKAELDEMTGKTCLELKFLGKRRSTLADKRIYLTELFSSACDIVHMAVTGNYEHAFFGRIDIKAAVEGQSNAHRLRAVVQYLNMQFAERIRQCGRKYHIEKEAATEEDGCDAESESFIERDDEGDGDKTSNKPIRMTRNQAIQWVIRILQRSRGRELPGIFNPMLISQLFWEQSERWESLARAHIDFVANSCKIFLLDVLDHVASTDVKARLLDLTVLPALKCAHEAALDELKGIVEDKKRHPITYNHYFTDTLQKIQRERYSRMIMELTKEATVTVSEKTFTGGPGYEPRRYIHPELLKQQLGCTINKDMDRFSAEQALDAHDAYYKDEQKYFIGIITKQVIERHLIAPLAELLSPKVGAQYSDREIDLVAAEPPEVVQLREHLENKKKMLEDGQDAFRVAMNQHL